MVATLSYQFLSKPSTIDQMSAFGLPGPRNATEFNNWLRNIAFPTLDFVVSMRFIPTRTIHFLNKAFLVAVDLIGCIQPLKSLVWNVITPWNYRSRPRPSPFSENSAFHQSTVYELQFPSWLLNHPSLRTLLVCFRPQTRSYSDSEGPRTPNVALIAKYSKMIKKSESSLKTTKFWERLSQGSKLHSEELISSQQ